MFTRINERIRANASLLDGARRHFRLAVGKNAYPERTVSHFFIRALVEALSPDPQANTPASGTGASALLEVAVVSGTSGRVDNHLDALVFNEDTAILAEFKRAWSPSHWKDLAADVRRVRGLVAQDIGARFLDHGTRQLIGFYGVDAWRQSVVDAWSSGQSHRNWNVPPEMAGMQRSAHVVWRDDSPDRTGKDYDGYYLLWAFEPLPPR